MSDGVCSDIQRTGPVKVLLAFVAHVPTRLLSTNWAEATLPNASVAVRAYAEGSLMSVAVCVRGARVVGRGVSSRQGYRLVRSSVIFAGKQNNRATKQG